MDDKRAHEDRAATAGALPVARRLVTAVEAALAELEQRIPDGLSPLELVEELRIRQTALRFVELAEQLADAELVVRGSTGQLRPHPLLKVEQELRREITTSLRDLTFRADSRATNERLNRLTSERSS